MNEGDTGDFQIHAADAHFQATQTIKFIRSGSVESDEREAAQENKVVPHPVISEQLLMRRSMAIDFREPTTQLFLRIRDSCSEMLIGGCGHAVPQTRMLFAPWMSQYR